jgi:hypothetical protein
VLWTAACVFFPTAAIASIFYSTAFFRKNHFLISIWMENGFSVEQIVKAILDLFIMACYFLSLFKGNLLRPCSLMRGFVLVRYPVTMPSGWYLLGGVGGDCIYPKASSPCFSKAETYGLHSLAQNNWKIANQILLLGI